jgi:hypothetical protein
MGRSLIIVQSMLMSGEEVNSKYKEQIGSLLYVLNMSCELKK